MIFRDPQTTRPAQSRGSETRRRSTSRRPDVGKGEGEGRGVWHVWRLLALPMTMAGGMPPCLCTRATLFGPARCMKQAWKSPPAHVLFRDGPGPLSVVESGPSLAPPPPPAPDPSPCPPPNSPPPPPSPPNCRQLGGVGLSGTGCSPLPLKCTRPNSGPMSLRLPADPKAQRRTRVWRGAWQYFVSPSPRGGDSAYPRQHGIHTFWFWDTHGIHSLNLGIRM